jgi:hypothetical protein
VQEEGAAGWRGLAERFGLLGRGKAGRSNP